MDFLFKATACLPQFHKTKLLVVTLAVLLSACQTLDGQLRQVHFEKMVNVVDPFACAIDHTNFKPSIYNQKKVERGIFCLLSYGVTDERLKEVADIAEIAYHKVVEYLEISNPRKITIIIRDEPKEKIARTKASIGRIIIPNRYLTKSIDDGLFIHEITHALMGLAGPVVSHESEYRSRRTIHITRHLVANALFIEGLATYLQIELADKDNLLKKKFRPHAVVKKVLSKDIRPWSLGTLHIDPDLFKHSDAIHEQKETTQNYMIASSFVKYLIEEYGLRKFLEVYEGGRLTAFYNEDIGGLQKEWEIFLGKNEMSKFKANGDTGYFDITKLTDTLICRKKESGGNFEEEAKRREITKKDCELILNPPPAS